MRRMSARRPVYRERQMMKEDDALRLVVEGTVAETGTDFFKALVKNLADVTDTVAAWVTEYLPKTKRLRAMAFWLKGGYLEDYEYAISGTACEPVVEDKKLIHIPEHLLDLYPHDEDPMLRDIVSYLGVPLLDTQGEVIGHLSVMDNKPLAAMPRIISLFEIFAARATAELRRLVEERERRAREEQLHALLAGAMDGILVLDEAYCVVQVNPAAEKLFGFDSKALSGSRLRDLLDNESAARLPALVQELDQRPEGERQLWIPQHLSAVRADGSTFPTEATLSAFVIREKRFHALILRSVNERVEAEKRIRHLMEEAEFFRESAWAGEMLGQSAPMKELFSAIKSVAATDATVLIEGETGTGKELIARSIHDESPRRDAPLVRVNCAAIPGTLIESELFGHERGAFTGATTKRDGRFALADGGTIFLDEVGELPLDLQAKLLRVLQEGEFEPLGATRTRKVDVRVVAATNRDLSKMVSEGTFREDLFYRLNVFPLFVPPLRERGGDVVLLARSFVEHIARRMGRRLDSLHPDDVRRLNQYPWPGNVRELQNVIERAIILSPGSRLELHRAMPEAAVEAPNLPSATKDEEAPILTAREMEALERANIERALTACGGKVSGDAGAAARLGLRPSTLSSRMKALGIARKA
ncbi:Fis family transcriptional regulator [Verrucomicrobiaceae bacterium SCGC AG-212-N21]|nr:Fis family transcriptional regulator [Verrucomicrobiaceae bacterium SCGC AG-212-N21]